MDVLLFTQSSLVRHIGCLQNGCCIYLQLWVEREGVVWYTRVMTLLPSFSLRIDLQNWSRSSCPSGQRQGWDGSPGLSTTASQGLLEAFQETYPVGSALELSDRLQGTKQSWVTVTWTCQPLELHFPNRSWKSFLWKLRSKLYSGTGLRQVLLGNPRSLDHSPLYIWGNRLLLLLESSRERRDGGHTERQVCGLCIPRRHRGRWPSWCWLWNLLWMLSRASLIAQLEGKGYPFQYSGLENSMNCIVHGVANSQTWLSDFHFHFGC